MPTPATPHLILNIKLALTILLGGVLLNTEAFAADATPPVGSDAVFATVGNVIITRQDYDAAFVEAARKKYYHSKPPDEEIAALQRQVGDTLVVNALLLGEARRRGLKPDDAEIKQKLDHYEQRYANNEKWQQTRSQTLAKLTRQLQEESLLNNLEKLIRKVPDPNVDQLREYYTAHQDKFTVPQQLRVSVILLKVDPSSPGSTWKTAYENAQDLVSRLRGGADFAELAREYSNDDSAEQGGDMGYLHNGMLDKTAQQAVDKLNLGDISDPVGLMEGVSIFRLTDRQPARLNSFEAAKDRVSAVWLSEQGDIAWTSLISQLKKKTPVHVDESRYLPLTVIPEKSVKK